MTGSYDDQRLSGAVNTVRPKTSAALSFRDDFAMEFRLLRQLPSYLRNPLTIAESRAVLRQRLERREAVFSDQPDMAEKCRRFGLVIPLAGSLRGEFGKDEVRAALARLTSEGKSIKAALSRAREWEEAEIAERPAVHRRVIDLIE